LCVIWKPQEWGGHEPRWVATPQKKKWWCTDLQTLKPIVSLYETDCRLQLLELRKCKRRNSVTCLNIVFKMPTCAMWRHARPDLRRIYIYFSAY